MRRIGPLLILSVLGCSPASTTGSSAGGSASGPSGPGATGSGGGDAVTATTATGTTTGAVTTGATMTTSGSGTPSGIQVLVEPSAGIQPLVNAIAGAKTSVHMTMYLLTSTTVMNALIAAHQAQREVKVVLNQQFPSGTNQNAAAFSKLQAAGVSVVYAPSNFTYTHEKCVIIDGTTAWIMTMNATVSSSTSNREYLAIDTYGADVAEAESIFQADYAHSSISPSGDLVVAPTNAEPKMVSLIKSAQQSIYVEQEELSDSYVVQALTGRADSGVAVDVVLSNITPTAAGSQALATLKAHHVKVVVLANPYVHAKAIVVDGTTAFVGSANLTYNSLASNRELGIITSVSQAVSTVSTTIAGDFANGTPQ